MDLKDMLPSVRPVLFSGAIATACAVAAALVVVVVTRAQTVVAAPGVVPQSTSMFTPGVFSSGDAIVSKRPDLAFMSVGVESLKPTASAAQSDLASKASKLTARAKALGIADRDITTSGYSVNPNYANSPLTVIGLRSRSN